MKTTVIGLGLIGGSIALDLRKAGLATEVVGIDLNPLNASKAVELGLVKRIENEGIAISTADLIILAIPVNALSQLLPVSFGFDQEKDGRHRYGINKANDLSRYYKSS